MPSLRSQSGWGTRLLVDFELLEVCNEAAFVQYSAILQAVCLKLEIYIADINDVVYVLVTTDLHMIPVGEHPESQFPHSLQQMFPGRVVGTSDEQETAEPDDVVDSDAETQPKEGKTLDAGGRRGLLGLGSLLDDKGGDPGLSLGDWPLLPPFEPETPGYVEDRGSPFKSCRKFSRSIFCVSC
ncbi:hypothetical protein DPMN_140871 [Dreissena polymorpha]|uniref:Uncharacterized protein n=1 Tax=Dreissena polymorpha TaxID=45954 RepID=A0A9D4G8F0_DREPO|nr:hypothetical protein DPMN_140871 [Dreissena polymorpha]